MGIFSSDERDIVIPLYVPPDYELRKRVYHNGHTAVKITCRDRGRFTHYMVTVVKGKVHSMEDVSMGDTTLTWFPDSQQGWEDAIEFMRKL